MDHAATRTKPPLEGRIAPKNEYVPLGDEILERALCEVFEEQVRRHPEHCAVVDDARRLTYAELNRAANRLARAIVTRLGPGPEPVALMVEPGARSIIAIFAALKANKFFVPLDPWAPAARIRRILEDSGAGLTLASARTLKAWQEAAPDGTSFLPVEEADAPGDAADLGLHPEADQPVALLYTSGSTGDPKGVIRTHRSALHGVKTSVNAYHLNLNDRIALVSSTSVAAAFSRIFNALLNGAGLYLYDLKSRGVDGLPDWIDRHGITILPCVPTVFRAAMSGLPEGRRFKSVRLVMLGGETIHRRDVELFRRHFTDDCLFRFGLKSTEGAGVGAMMFIDRSTPVPDDIMPAGYPTADAEVLILDDDGNDAGAGNVGEIVLKSRYLSPGYWRRPELSARAFLAVPGEEGVRMYRTGDLGRRDEDGRIYHLGRKDFQVKIRGHRIEIEEVERALLRVDGVRQAAVKVAGDVEEQRRLVACVVADGAPMSVAALRSALAAILPEYMIPSAFIFMDALPMTANGKVDRRALPDAPIRPAQETLIPPRNAAERRLAACLAETLHLDAVGIRDNFFELGGNSLAAAHFLARVEKEFGCRLPIQILIGAPTVETLAVALQAAIKPARACLAPLQPGTGGIPLYLVPGAASDVITLGTLAHALGREQPVFAFQALGINHESEKPHRTVEEMAAHYVGEILARQPDGPYMVGGRCFGGFVAFEMARQLREQGREVGLLVLLDSSQPPPMATLRSHARELLFHHLPRGQLIFCLKHDLHEKWRHTVANWRHRKMFRRLRGVWQAHTEARRSYQPKPYPGRIMLIQSVEFNTRFPNYRARWEALAGGGLDYHAIAGGHFGQLRGESLKEVSARLRTAIAQVRAESGEAM